MHDRFWHTNQQALIPANQSSDVEILFREPTLPFTVIGPVSSFGAPLRQKMHVSRCLADQWKLERDVMPSKKLAARSKANEQEEGTRFLIDQKQVRTKIAFAMLVFHFPQRA